MFFFKKILLCHQTLCESQTVYKYELQPSLYQKVLVSVLCDHLAWENAREACLTQKPFPPLENKSMQNE